MTQQEYDKAKQGCWENFKFARRPLNTDKKVFDYIFDRAYALGKQEKDAVTNEEIEKLSFEFAEDKKWHDFNDLRSRARLLRQFTAFLLKKYTIQTK